MECMTEQSETTPPIRPEHLIQLPFTETGETQGIAAWRLRVHLWAC